MTQFHLIKKSKDTSSCSPHNFDVIPLRQCTTTKCSTYNRQQPAAMPKQQDTPTIKKKKRVKRKLIGECAKKKKSKIKRYKRTVKHSLLTKKLPVSLKWEHYNSAPNFAILTDTMFIKVRCKQHRITPHYVSPQDENVLLKACYTKH